MSLDLYPEFYNDVFGPVMQPGSSSHTAGPCRLGYLAGGTLEQVENAASLSFQAATGIPCDPIPGGFGQPCRSRILTAICMASVFADLALAGRQAVLSLHEAIDVMDTIGRELPVELLCTSKGGAAAAPAALRQALEY